MSDAASADPPFMQRLYDRIWLVAIVATLFFILSYVVWGLVDVFAIPAG